MEPAQSTEHQSSDQPKNALSMLVQTPLASQSCDWIHVNTLSRFASKHNECMNNTFFHDTGKKPVRQQIQEQHTVPCSNGHVLEEAIHNLIMARNAFPAAAVQLNKTNNLVRDPSQRTNHTKPFQKKEPTPNKQHQIKSVLNPIQSSAPPLLKHLVYAPHRSPASQQCESTALALISQV